MAGRCPSCDEEINSVTEIVVDTHKNTVRLPESEEEKQEVEFDLDDGLMYIDSGSLVSEERYHCPECGSDITDLIGDVASFLKGG